MTTRTPFNGFQDLLRRTRTAACTCAILLGALWIPLAQAHYKSAPAYNLTGTWRMTITTYDCITLAENPSFAGYLTFSSDGTAAETTASPAFQPGQRSAGHGYWERDGRNTYRMVVEAFILFSNTATPPAPSFQRGKQRLEASLRMTGRDKFESEWSTVAFFNTAGVKLMGGCARSSGERLW